MKPICQDYSYLLPKESPLLIRSKGTVAPCPSIPTINAPRTTPKADLIFPFEFTDSKGNIVTLK